MSLSPLVAMAADCEMDSSFSSSGVPVKVEATNPAPLSHVPAPAPVAQETPWLEAPTPVTRALSKAPPLPVLRFPKVGRGGAKV